MLYIYLLLALLGVYYMSSPMLGDSLERNKMLSVPWGAECC